MNPNDITTYPIYPHLDHIIDTLKSKGALLLSAAPGAGKTTLVPWRMLQDPDFTARKILLLQPRRLAARAAAERIASLVNTKVGGRVGLRTRLETTVGPSTILEVVTVGVLLRIIQNDPGLEGYGTVIFDEFHERGIQGDLGLALAWDSREQIRPDLRLVVMSATLPSGDIHRAYGDIPILGIPGKTFPVKLRHLPPIGKETIWSGAARLVGEAFRERRDPGGDILAFLPGYREIYRTQELLKGTLPAHAIVDILHGSMPGEDQRRVLRHHAGGARIILSTNVAESSVTIPGVTAVVDSGYERRVRYSPRTGMDHWETVRISAASAEQRRGRAGRTGPGLCLRWWSADERLVPFPTPEILDADLSPMLLETAAWGVSSLTDLRLLDYPPAPNVKKAASLLAQLQLLDPAGKITAAGRRAAALGMHPRLARMLDEAARRGLTQTAALIAALLEEGEGIARDSHDFRERMDAWLSWRHGHKTAIPGGAAVRVREIMQRALRSVGETAGIEADKIAPDQAGTLLALAYPDRIARRTDTAGPGSRWVLGGGRGARLAHDFPGEEFIVIPEMDGGETEARVFNAAPIGSAQILEGLDRGPQETTAVEWRGWAPSARVEVRADGLLLGERRGSPLPPALVQSEALARLSAGGLDLLPWSEPSRRFLARCRYVQRRGIVPDWPDFSDAALLADAESWLFPFGRWNGGAVFDETSLVHALHYRLGGLDGRMNDLAPESITLPSGTHRRVEYDGEIPVIAARLQEFFGCAETPRIGGEPVLLHLLSPAGRPLQITRDLGGFWRGSYSEVRKEMRGRYPRHPWPENPLEASPTTRAKPRKR